MNDNVIYMKRTAEACGCNACDGKDFSIVDDKEEGFIVVCDCCAGVIGKLLVIGDE